MRKYVKRATIMFAAALACTLAAGSVSAKKEPVNRVIVFGDSLSDGGFYVALDPTIPAGAGSFTTNPDPVAPEVVASELNLTLDTAYGADGTNYAVGGARVSEPNLLSVPIATQAAGFAATERFFNSDDLVYIQGGGNDFFAYVADGATDTSILTNAATELAELVDLLGRSGARRVVTMSVQSVGVAGGLLFNQTYEDELAALGVNALYFDMDALFDEVIADTATFGITNTVDVACTDSSLICTPDSYVATDANETYLRADSVHPAGITQRIQGEAIASLLLAPDQIGQLAYAAEALFDGQRALHRQVMHNGLGQGQGNTAIYGAIGHHTFDNTGSGQRIGVEEDGVASNVAIDHQFGETLGAGFSFAYSTGDGSFDRNRGGYDVDAMAGSLYVRGQFSSIRVSGDLTYGRVNYDSLSRNVTLGPAARVHEGDTDGTYTALHMDASYPVFANDFVQLAFETTLAHNDSNIDGYSESTQLSTAATFGSQGLRNTIAGLGIAVQSAGERRVGYHVQANYKHEFGRVRDISITPVGAPISYTSEIYSADADYVSYDLGIALRVNQAVSVRAGLSGYALRGDLDSHNIFVSAIIAL
ncbi:MAG: autotransporter domain-containing protein [Pseudomonadales bacterium]|nr:autotransporter domain-containing protein [Pseudomonadales bacterium]MDP7595304.1 autotransporter domain-containing protein [Pseudomonadales bacterium]HJN53272.1 autotransporter domain-containing protein [Pseudomonadales bacterium]